MRVFLICLLLSLLCLGCRPTKQAPNQTVGNPLSQNEHELKQAIQTQTASISENSHVITSETEYYTTGPQQGRPADGKFTAGTKVILVENLGSYALVQLASGLTAYIIAEALEPPKLPKGL